MRIEILTTFLDDKDEFIKDEVRIVDDKRGARFVANGWAKDCAGRVATGAQQTGEVTLDIQSVTTAQEVQNA